MMVVTPKTRGFISITSHPTGCYKNVERFAKIAKENLNVQLPKRVLIIGSSAGYGLSCRIAAAFGGGADTIGVYFEKEAAGKRTATAGFYNDSAFLELANKNGGNHLSINGDAYSKEIKQDTIRGIKEIMPEGKVDLIVYSLASPKRTDHNGVTHSSVIKPIGQNYKNKTVDFHTGEVTEIEVNAATEEEIENTVAVMGGEDWKLWIEALNESDSLAENVATVAFSYIGPEITHPIYTNGTIGKAKLDLEEKAQNITEILSPFKGRALVSVNKAIVTQASSAIPVVPLYISILYKVMREAGTHEGSLEQIIRMYQRMYSVASLAEIPTDDKGRLRLDDWEMEPEIQFQVSTLWEKINSDNIYEISDLKNYRDEFFALFGFGIDGVDYDQPVEV